MTLGEKIRSLRKTAGLSQEAFAEQLGVSRQAVSKWENDNGLPETEKLINMAKLFGVSLDTLIGEESTDDAPAAEQASAPPESLSDAGHSTDLSLVESYLDSQHQRAQRIGLAVLLLIASLGLTFFSPPSSCCSGWRSTSSPSPCSSSLSPPMILSKPGVSRRQSWTTIACASSRHATLPNVPVSGASSSSASSVFYSD